MNKLKRKRILDMLNANSFSHDLDVVCALNYLCCRQDKNGFLCPFHKPGEFDTHCLAEQLEAIALGLT